MTRPVSASPHSLRPEPRSPWPPRRSQSRGPRHLEHHQRRLAADLTLAEAGERRRVAEGLHDQVGPLLTLARMQLDAIENSTGRPLAEVRDLVCQALTEIRQMTFDLRAPLLESHGLGAALTDLGRSWQGRHGVLCDVTVPDLPLGLDEEWKIFLLRAARELLWNIVKHANAYQVSVSLEQRDGVVRLNILDDGDGFEGSRFTASPPALRTTEAGGFGLPELRRRAEHLGGRLDIETSNQGTRVEISVPIAAAASTWPAAV